MNNCSFSRLNSLMEDLHESRNTMALLTEAQQKLTDSTAIIEQLEYDLAQKAQECEDADDKELALRKDNKRLAARMVTLQTKIEKLQQTASPVSLPSSQSAVSPNAIVSELTPKRATVAQAPSSSSRKRRAPEDEDMGDIADVVSAPASTRAIYAPKVTAPRPVKTTSLPSVTVAPKPATNQITSAPIRKISHSPSDLIAKRMRSPKKDSLQDRTNLQQPRQQSEKPTPNGDSQHFMAKLNRYRPPTIPLQSSQ